MPLLLSSIRSETAVFVELNLAEAVPDSTSFHGGFDSRKEDQSPD
jgi:hypothetical protein